MFCAKLSSQRKAPKVAVLSPNSKCIFEKSLIESYVEQNGIDPISKDALSTDQLIAIASTPQQYALTNAVNSSTLKSNYSIPNLLTSLQNEWDAVMLENFQLRQQLDTCKKELSTALYRYDAAMRVATRATMEADKIKHELSTLTKHIGIDESEAEVIQKLPNEMLERLIQKSSKVAKESRKRKLRTVPPETFVFEPENNTRTLREGDYKIESRFVDGSSLADKVSVAYSANGTCYLIAGPDVGNLYHQLTLKSEELISYAIPMDNSRLIFGTLAGSTGIFDLESQDTKILSTHGHGGSIVHIAWPTSVTEEYYITVRSDGSVLYSNIENTRTFLLFKEDFEPILADVHKDGLIILLASREKLHIHSISKMEDEPMTLPHSSEEDGDIVSAKFGLNGYWLLVAATKTFKVFDLRKPNLPLASEVLNFENKMVKAYDIDPTGKFLFVLTQGPSDESETHYFQYDKPTKKWILNWSKNNLTTFERKHFDEINYVQQGERTYLQVRSSNDLFSVELNK